MNNDLSSIVNSEQFKALINEAIAAQLARFVGEQERRAKEISLIERVIRVEETLIAQTKVIESLQREMNERFEAMDKRFEAMDKRFESLQREMNARFESLQREMSARFEAMNVRFEAMDKRFETMDKRFETMDKNFEMLTRRIDRFMFWSFGITLTVGGLVVAAVKLLP